MLERLDSTMFLAIDFTSVNRPMDLPEGLYEQEIHTLERADRMVRASLILYAKVGDDGPTAADLLIGELGGSVRATDFMKLPDGSWRDADGLRAKALEMLIPKQVLEMPAIEVICGNAIEVKHEQ